MSITLLYGVLAILSALGLSEWAYFEGSNFAIFISASLLNRGHLLKD